MTIRRDAAPRILALSQSFPVVTITGPRQSGKTTLCQDLFPNKPYLSLESLDLRDYASNDPRAFLKEYRDGAVIDEVQRVPDLLSYLQTEVDRDAEPGRFVLTGSANLALLQSVSQSLAGRTALITLLPCTRGEIERFSDPPETLAPKTLWEHIWRGGFPAIPDRGVAPGDWFEAYISTYVERDVRQITNVTDLAAFQTFLELMAGRTGQLLNLSQVGSDVGITHNTAKAWLSVLETGYVAFRLRPFHANVRKRLVKSPKTYFYDTGLACFLIGIRSPDQLATHPLRGPLFENYVVCEVLKSILNRGNRPRLSFYRDHQGHEVDLLVESGPETIAVEVKSGRTIASDFFRDLDWLSKHEMVADHGVVKPVLVYGGVERQRRSSGEVVPWREVGDLDWG